MSTVSVKPSEVIRMALSDPSYLDGQNWFCSVVCDLQEAGKFSENEHQDTSDEIYLSLGSSALLRRKLINEGIITGNTKYYSEEYKVAAHAHWNALILKLEQEGK